MTLLDETVKVAHFDDCAYLAEEQVAGRIAMGAILAVTGLSLLGLALLCAYHRRRARGSDDEVDLVSHMEVWVSIYPFSYFYYFHFAIFQERAATSSSSLPRAASNGPAPAPAPENNAREEPAVHYVVPNGDAFRAKKGSSPPPPPNQEEHELKVWVSTSNGLRRVDDSSSGGSNSGVGTSPASSTRSSNSSSSSGGIGGESSNSGRGQSEAVVSSQQNGSSCTTILEEPQTPSSSHPKPEETPVPTPDRSLGAIPKTSCRRQSQQQQYYRDSRDSPALPSSRGSDTISNSSSSVISR